MKQIVKMSRLTSELEKMFRALNEAFYDNALDMPVLTVTPSSRSYAHYTPWDAWQTADTPRREINIASGTLDRPLEAIAASLLHEMSHMYNDLVLNVQDTSRSGTYHNRRFAETAAAHGLIVHKVDKYGYAKTEAADSLIEFLCDHDEFREIEMYRVNPALTAIGTGSHVAHGGASSTTTKSNSIRHVCPKCGAIARTTRPLRLICADCAAIMTV